jgi:hypothetical protein
MSEFGVGSRLVQLHILVGEYCFTLDKTDTATGWTKTLADSW